MAVKTRPRVRFLRPHGRYSAGDIIEPPGGVLEVLLRRHIVEMVEAEIETAAVTRTRRGHPRRKKRRKCE